MKIRIGERSYDAAAAERLTLRQWLQIEQETSNLGHRLTLAEYGALQEQLRKTPKAERGQHPEMMWVLAVIVYASRVAAGDDVTFGDAIDFPVGELEFIAEATDVEEPDPTQARPDSGPGSRPRPADRKRKASKPRSTAA